MANNGNSGRTRILVIGGVAAGASAASKAKRIDPDADVKMIQEETHTLSCLICLIIIWP